MEETSYNEAHYTPCPENCAYCNDPHYGHPKPHPGQQLKQCNGEHYNFKKGMEFCPNREKCQHYKNDPRRNFKWDSIKDFRNCKLFETAPIAPAPVST